MLLLTERCLDNSFIEHASSSNKDENRVSLKSIGFCFITIKNHLSTAEHTLTIKYNNILFDGKLSARRPRKLSPSWEIRSTYPIRENVWEYLHENKSEHNFHIKRTRSKQPRSKKRGKSRMKMFALMFVAAGIAISLWMTNRIPQGNLITEEAKTKLLNFLGVEQTTLVSEECCHRMKYLAEALLRAQQTLRNTLRLRRATLITTQTKELARAAHNVESGYIHDASVTKGSDTTEWGGKVALWGVFPLWRAAPSPDTVLALRKPTPSDCWPFSGSQGEIIIDFSKKYNIHSISVEHVYPDTAQSAPKHFMLHGILENGTTIKAIDAEYRNKGPAKQHYYMLDRNIPLKRVVFRVLSNQGNQKYTCIYRVHIFGSVANLVT